jgi:DNA-binding response OmpR family regulator
LPLGPAAGPSQALRRLERAAPRFAGQPLTATFSAMKGTVLLIDDDRKLGRLLTDYLAKFGFRTTALAHPDEAMRALRREAPDIVILDVMLPGRDGFQVCKDIRRDFTVPIIMLTARGEVADRVLGLELGADDYLPKPFEPRELVARMQTVLRRGSGAGRPDQLRHGRLSVDFHRREASLGGKPLDLSAMEFEVLTLFALSPGKVMDRDHIMERTKGMEWEPYNRSIDVLISRLRQKLGDDPRRPAFLKTVRGTGYMYIGHEDDDGRDHKDDGEPEHAP